MKQTRVHSKFATLLLVIVSLAGCTGNGSQSVPARGVEAVPLNTRNTVPETINEGSAIHFEHALPAQNVDDRHNGTYNNVELAIPGVLTTQNTDLGMMMKWLRDNVQGGRHTVFVEGEAIPVYKNWIRDHVHTMKAFRHWEHNLRAYLDFTLAHQRADGSYYELIKQMDDRHWAYVAEDDVLFFPEDNLYLARLDIEADVEYLVVEGAAGIAAWGSLPDGPLLRIRSSVISAGTKSMGISLMSVTSSQMPGCGIASILQPVSFRPISCCRRANRFRQFC